ncbi:hypothetical protein BJX76DRAFT_75749 [Aspergillus varians]
MVFLRLTVKVYPRDQAPPSNSFSLRSFLGDRERDDASRTSSGATAGKPANFLIVLENPEDITLGGLAGMIRAKWRKLRPGVEPLAIKKLLDDDHEADDLDTDMTVADVFVDNGKARSDGFDQRRTVRVIQKPAGGEVSPVRFPSVAQDWDAAAENYEVERQKKKQEAESAVNKLGAIAEESRRGSGSRSSFDVDGWADYTPNRTHRQDIPVSSVEKDEIPVSPSQSVPKSSTRGFSHDLNGEGLSAPQDHRMGSQELGDSPRSSIAATPKKKLTPARRDSTHSQASESRSKSSDERVFDSPGLQLAREHTYSVSPQKRPAPEVTMPDPIPLDEELHSENELEANDDDIAMRDEPTPGKQTQSPVTLRQRATTVDITAPSFAVVGAQTRKRKASADQLSPNKEPRLARATPPPPDVNGERRNSEVSPGTPRFSPSGRRLGGAESFSGVARRLSFTERQSEPPSHGLGLGITRSPAKKAETVVDLSQNSTQSTGAGPQSTPVPMSSAPTFRRGSITQSVSTPTNLPTPADKPKNIHSALRKDAFAERNSIPRSVSFVEGDEVLITGSQPVPTSAPMDAAEPHKNIPASQTSRSGKRRSSSSMVFPPGVSMERIAQYEREAEEKIERETKERAEFEEKIKVAEKDKSKSDYLAKLKAAFRTWQTIVKNNQHNQVERRARFQNQLKEQLAEIHKMEDSMSKASSHDKGKKPQSSQKTPKSQQGPKNDTPAQTKPTPPAPAANGDKKSPVTHIAGWSAINANSPVSDEKSATPTANVAGTKSTPKARTVATKTLVASKASKPSSLQSQNSTASDEVDLPAVKVHARANANATGTKKPTPQKPVEVSSSSESEDSSEEETSSDDSSSSDSDSDSASEPETKNKTNTTAALAKSPAQRASSQKSRAVSSPPSHQTAQAQTQSQSQSESWRWPRASQTGSTRLSLKSIKGEVASQVQAQAAAKAAPHKKGQARRDIFSPPDSDSDETESESESESESDSSSSSSDSDSDSEDEKKKQKEEKRGNSPVSVGDEGDIMSSGQVRKLKPARGARG